MKYSKLRIWWSDKPTWEKVLFVIEPILFFAITALLFFTPFHGLADFVQIGTLIVTFGMMVLDAVRAYKDRGEWRGSAYFQLFKMIAWLLLSQLILLPAYK